MGVESNSGAADARAIVTWPSAEVAARLNPLPNCSFSADDLCTDRRDSEFVGQLIRTIKQTTGQGSAWASNGHL